MLSCTPLTHGLFIHPWLRGACVVSGFWKVTINICVQVFVPIYRPILICKFSLTVISLKPSFKCSVLFQVENSWIEDRNLGVLTSSSLLCRWLPNDSGQVALGCQISGEVFKVLQMRKPKSSVELVGVTWLYFLGSDLQSRTVLCLLRQLGSCRVCASSCLLYVTVSGFLPGLARAGHHAGPRPWLSSPSSTSIDFWLLSWHYSYSQPTASPPDTPHPCPGSISAKPLPTAF